MAGEPNLAVESALLEALPTMLPASQAAALEVITKRGHASGLSAVVTRYESLDHGAQRLILSRIGDFFGGVRSAVGSASLEDRLSGLELIEQSGDARLAYLLGAALRVPCPRTRERAAAVLSSLAGRLAEKHVLRTGSPEVAAFDEARAQLAGALEDVIRGWEAHLQPKALEAALYFPDVAAPALGEKLIESRSHIAIAVNGLLEGSTDWRLAGFALRALSMPLLRKSAVSLLSAGHEPAFLRALGAHVHLLADPEVRKGCLWLKELRFLEGGADALTKLPAGEAVAIVWLIAASGLAPPRKVHVYGELLAQNDSDLTRAVVHQIAAEPAEWATQMLTVLSSRRRDEVGPLAAAALASRRGAPAPVAVGADVPGQSRGVEAAVASPRAEWDRLWRRFDDLSAEERVVAAEHAVHSGMELLAPLRAKLASSQPLDRARALRIARTLGLVRRMEEEVYRLTSDTDPVVRSAAISVLAELPGVTSERILRRAVDDSDHRVQANAIEVLDAFGSDERQGLLHGKLGSPSSRVRANAIKALLRLELKEAADVLLDMLDHPSRAQRMSALWVVEHLHLESVLHRIERMTQGDADDRVRHRAARVLQALTRGFAHAAAGAAGGRTP